MVAVRLLDRHLYDLARAHGLTLRQVIEYLLKKGYTKTEAQLRSESQADAGGERPNVKQSGENHDQTIRAVRKLKATISMSSY